MIATRKKEINGHTVQEYYETGKYLVTIDGRPTMLNFEEAERECGLNKYN